MTIGTPRRRLSGPAIALMAIAAGSIGAESAAAQAPLHPTKTNVVCNTHAAAGHAVGCGVSVSDLSAHPTAPTGTVVLTTNTGPNHGTFSAGSCTLVPVNSRTSRCTFTYTPTTTQATRVYGNYLGDATHAPSAGHADINGVPILPPPPPPPPPPADDESFADLNTDFNELTAAIRAGNRTLAAQIRAEIQSDVRDIILNGTPFTPGR
ncbi:MAG: hypothetical protein QOE27_1572 [Solirubrobacteraceae bacterium]|nr:hypothetical protein [Solirubrobacteraceae bacterium]